MNGRPNGSAPFATYTKSQLPGFGFAPMAKFPSPDVMVARGLDKRVSFFGCGQSVPLVIYAPNLSVVAPVDFAHLAQCGVEQPDWDEVRSLLAPCADWTVLSSSPTPTTRSRPSSPIPRKSSSRVTFRPVSRVPSSTRRLLARALLARQHARRALCVARLADLADLAQDKYCAVF